MTKQLKKMVRSNCPNGILNLQKANKISDALHYMRKWFEILLYSKYIKKHYASFIDLMGSSIQPNASQPISIASIGPILVIV